MNPILLQAHQLTKEYKPGVGAVDINLSVSKGEIIGFVGPNGAGKTTTLRMIMKLINPDRGEISILDNCISSIAEFSQYKEIIGYQPSEGGLYEHVTASQLFKYGSRMYKNSKEIFRNALELAHILDLDIKTKISKLSFGNKKKVSIINALMHNPQIIILDEPTAGLDPLIQIRLLEILDAMKKLGCGILLSSHVLSEVQTICDRVIFIKDARIIIDDTVKNVLKLTVSQFKILHPTKIIKTEINELPSVELIEEIGEDILVYTKEKFDVIRILLKHDHDQFYVESPNLEKTFLHLYA